MAAEPPRPTRTPYTLKPKTDFKRANPASDSTSPSADHDVYAWRAQERAIEHRAGRDELAEPPVPPSRRRRRDYWLLMAGGAIVFVPLITYGFTAGNPILFVSAIGGLSLFSISLTWVMWQVMSRY